MGTFTFTQRQPSLPYASFLVSLAAVFGAGAIGSAAPFQNLGFELPVEGSFGDAEIPFWTANAPVAPPDTGGCLAAGCIGVYDANSLIGLPTLQGHQTLLLQPPIPDPFDPSILRPAVVSQLGDIPANATDITLWARIFPTSLDPPEEEDVVGVSINLADIPLTVVDRIGEITVLGGDVASLSGQTVVLDISAETDLAELFIAIDDVRFIPEPATSSMMAVCFAVLLVLRR